MPTFRREYSWTRNIQTLMGVSIITGSVSYATMVMTKEPLIRHLRPSFSLLYEEEFHVTQLFSIIKVVNEFIVTK